MLSDIWQGMCIVHGCLGNKWYEYLKKTLTAKPTTIRRPKHQHNFTPDMFENAMGATAHPFCVYQ